jgi:prepilin-type N-terminal cleavage/methylation domain-containing protein
VIARLRSRLAADDGFSLIELMAAMAIGGVVLTALMTVFVTGVKGTSEITDRVDSSARANTAMNRITTLLDSQVCVPTSVVTDIAAPPIFAASNDTSVTFYADLSGAGDTPDKYTLTFDPAARTIKLYTYGASGTTPSRTWTSSTTAETIASNVTQVTTAGVVQPVFTYFTYISGGNATTNGTVNTAPAATPLSAANANATVKVGVLFQSLGIGERDNKQRTVVSGSGAIATFNASSTAPTVCP